MRRCRGCTVVPQQTAGRPQLTPGPWLLIGIRPAFYGAGVRSGSRRVSWGLFICQLRPSMVFMLRYSASPPWITVNEPLQNGCPTIPQLTPGGLPDLTWPMPRFSLSIIRSGQAQVRWTFRERATHIPEQIFTLTRALILYSKQSSTQLIAIDASCSLSDGEPQVHIAVGHNSACSFCPCTLYQAPFSRQSKVLYTLTLASRI